jgi:hypothetical protein
MYLTIKIELIILNFPTMTYKMETLIALSILLMTLVQSRLVVYGPPELKDKFTRQGITITSL